MTDAKVPSPLALPEAGWKPRRSRLYERGTKIRIDNLPSPEDLAHAHERHRGEDADRFSLYTPVQIEQETKDVRLCMTFGDVIKVRDQAEMIIAGMRAIIEKTRQHDIGSTRQRIESRAEAASLGRALSRFNGRTPYGDWKPRPRKS